MSTLAPSTDQRLSHVSGFVLVLGLLLLILGFREALSELIDRWMRQEEYSHGSQIQFFTSCMLWTPRDAIMASLGRPSWTGLLLILLASGMLIVVELTA